MKKVIISSTYFLAALEEIKSVSSKNAIIPILSDTFFIDVDGDDIIMQTSDLNYMKIVECSGASKVSFKCVVEQLSVIIQLLKTIPEQPIVLIFEEEMMKFRIKAELGVFTFNAQNHLDWPKTLDFSQTESECEGLDYMTFRDVFKSLSPFVSKDQLRPAMTGIHYDSEKMRFVATDAHKLKWVETSASLSIDFIMRNPIKHLPGTKMKEQSVSIKVTPGGFATGIYYTRNGLYVTLIIRNLSEERYPNYKDVIPKKHKRTLSVNKDDFLKAVTCVEAMSNSYTHLTVFTQRKDKIILSSENEDFSSDARVEIEEFYLKKHKGEEEFVMGFNSRLMLETLKSISSESISIKTNQNNEAIVVDDTSLVMPAMINV